MAGTHLPTIVQHARQPTLKFELQNDSLEAQILCWDIQTLPLFKNKDPEDKLSNLALYESQKSTKTIDRSECLQWLRVIGLDFSVILQSSEISHVRDLGWFWAGSKRYARIAFVWTLALCTVSCLACRNCFCEWQPLLIWIEMHRSSRLGTKVISTVKSCVNGTHDGFFYHLKFRCFSYYWLWRQGCPIT